MPLGVSDALVEATCGDFVLSSGSATPASSDGTELQPQGDVLRASSWSATQGSGLTDLATPSRLLRRPRSE